MNKNLKKEINKYIREINSNIICDYKTRKKYIGDIKASVYDYIEENNVTGADEIYKHFGTPQEISKAFFENADIKKIKKRMNFTRIILIGVITVILVWAVALTIDVIDTFESNRGYGYEIVHDEEDFSLLDMQEDIK